MIFILIPIIWFLILFLFIYGFYSNKKNKRNRIFNVNESAKIYFKDNNFNPDKYIFIDNYSTINYSEKQFIAIDRKENKICLIDYENHSFVIVDFKNVVDFEIYEDNVDSMTGSSYEWGKKRRLSTYEATQVTKCKELRLVIYIDDIETNSITYELIGGTFFNAGYNRQSNTYKTCVKSLQNVTGFLKSIKKENIKDS